MGNFTSGPRVLIVERDEETNPALSEALATAGYQVLRARSFSSAVQILERSTVHLALVDLSEHQEKGLDLIRQLKKSNQDVLTFFMNGFSKLQENIEAIHCGAIDFLAKPVCPDEAMLRIRIAQARRPHSSTTSYQSQERKLIGETETFQHILKIVDKVANQKANVLILGESGTGKEGLARRLHTRSSRKSRPFVPINCGAIPPALLESELFGHQKGAFTNADRTKKGLVEAANGGTLFLDEIGDLPLELQVKFLRFLQEGEIRPVGSNKVIPVDVRVVAATSRSLETMLLQKSFREDLYYRLNVIPIHVPPLRERKKDIPQLIELFCSRFEQENQLKPISFSEAAQHALINYPWPGNIRELENLVEQITILTENESISLQDLPPKILKHRPTSEPPTKPPSPSLKSRVREA